MAATVLASHLPQDAFVEVVQVHDQVVQPGHHAFGAAAAGKPLWRADDKVERLLTWSVHRTDEEADGEEEVGWVVG